MKKFWLIFGISLWVIGVVWVLYVSHEVVARKDTFLTFDSLWVPIGIHAVIMFLGGVAVSKSRTIDK